MQHVAQGLASLGRGNDTQLVHMTPGEVQGLQGLAMAHGGSLTINPHTGLPEAGFLSSILPMAATAAGYYFGGPMGAAVGSTLGNMAVGKSLGQSMAQGAMAYGFSSIGGSLSDSGAAELEKAKALANPLPELSSDQLNLLNGPGNPFAPPSVPTPADPFSSSDLINGRPPTAQELANARVQESLFQPGPGPAPVVAAPVVPTGPGMFTPDRADWADYANKLAGGDTLGPNQSIEVDRQLDALNARDATEPTSRRIIPGGPTEGVRVTPTSTSLSPVPAPVYTPIASVANLQTGNATLQAAGNAGASALSPADDLNKLISENRYQSPSELNKLSAGIGKATDSFSNLSDFAKANKVPLAVAGIGALGAALPSMTQQSGLGSTVIDKGNIRPYTYAPGTVNPNFGKPGEPYFLNQGYAALPTYKAAAGGQIQAPSMPLDLSQNYPGSNITKSSYATLPSTDSQEVVDGYGPKINPFTGAEGMAEGGLADTQIYTNDDPEMRREAGLKGLSDSQLSMLSDEADDAGTQAAATKELQLRGPKRRTSKSAYMPKMAAGGMASLPEYAAGGKLLRGAGDGMSDDIPAVIKGAKPQRAALADGEFVVPADVVSHLGNGSTEAGAKRLYSMMDKVRQARTGRKAQGRQIKAEKYIPA